MKKLLTLVIVVLFGALLARTCLYTVNEREYALVFMLGELKSVVSTPGLHVKLPAPLQNVVYLDKRILTIDTPTADLVQTSEKKNLMIDSYVKWRINDPRRYWVSFQGSERAAEDRMSALLRDVLNQVVNRRTVNDITSSDRARAMAEISEALQKRVSDLGIEVVDVRLKRVDFTPEISESVYRRMEAERKRVASEERSKGAAEAEKIKADADRQRTVVLAEAYRDAQSIKGSGDAQANELYAKAFNKDPEFAKFYRSLDAYRQSFNKPQDMMVVDPSSEFFDYLKNSHGEVQSNKQP
jgi:modulator of FtsH protease HflC